MSNWAWRNQRQLNSHTHANVRCWVRGSDGFIAPRSTRREHPAGSVKVECRGHGGLGRDQARAAEGEHYGLAVV